MLTEEHPQYASEGSSPDPNVFSDTCRLLGPPLLKPISKSRQQRGELLCPWLHIMEEAGT